MKKIKVCFSIGQSLIEYSIILAVVMAALVGMQVYMKRGIQGVIKTSADQLGPQRGAPVSINFRRQRSSVTVTDTSKSGVTRTQVFSDSAQLRDTNATTTSVSHTTSLSQE